MASADGKLDVTFTSCRDTLPVLAIVKAYSMRSAGFASPSPLVSTHCPEGTDTAAKNVRRFVRNGSFNVRRAQRSEEELKLEIIWWDGPRPTRKGPCVLCLG